MDSLLATYASSDEEDNQPQQQQSNSNSQTLKTTNSSSSNPKPKSSAESIESSNSLSKSLFSKLPQPKSERSDPFSLKPKKVVQFRPPVIRKVIDDDDDDEDDNKKKVVKKDDFIPQAPSVKSWLSSIPAPRNSGSLGSLSSSGGTGRRSIVESEVPALSSLKDSGKDTVNVNVNKDNTYVGVNANAVETSADYVNYDYSNYGGYENVETGYSSYGPAAPAGDDYASYSSYEGYSDYGNNVQYESKWVDRSGGNLESEVSVATVIQNVARVPGKRGRNEIPQEIIEVSQDELMKNRPREDQVKATGIAFGPSYQVMTLKMII